MSLIQWFIHHSVDWFARVAAALTLVALAIMAYSILVPRALPVMLAMSLGHAVGIAGFGCFFIAVVLDSARRRTSSYPPRPPAAMGPNADSTSESTAHAEHD